MALTTEQGSTVRRTGATAGADGTVRQTGTASSDGRRTEARWINDELPMSHIQRSLRGLPEGQSVSLAVGFNNLNRLCDLLLKEGWHIQNIDLMKDEPGCVISAKNSPPPDQ